MNITVRLDTYILRHCPFFIRKRFTDYFVAST